MANEVATTQAKPEIVKFREQLESRAGEIQMALPAHITPEKFQRTLLTAVQSNADLLRADRQSLVLACMKAAQDGLLPDGREAALVMFKENKKQPDGSWKSRQLVQYMPMVYGLRKKILQSNEVAALEVGVVYHAEVEAGKFLYEVGLQPPLRHRPMLDLDEKQTKDSEIVAAYSIATMKDGTKSFELMRRFEIDKVRECSQTGATRDRKGQARTPSGPWVEWFPEQAKKTVMRRHSKTLPQSGDVIIDIEGRELEAGASIVRALESQQPDAPQIEHRDEEEVAHDPETGEILDDGDERVIPDQQEEMPKRKRRTKAEMEADKAASQSAEGNEAAPVESDATTNDATASDASGQSDINGADDEQASDEGDQLGESNADSINDFQIVAEDLINSFKKATTVIDLERLYNDSDEARSTMPEEIASVVESSYQIEKRRLKGGASG